MRSISSAFLAFSIMVSTSAAKAERWVVTTLEWPPFTCSRCPENGAAAKALKDVMKSVGVSVEFVFYPWAQTKRKGARPEVVGYFPAWRESVPAPFVASEALFHSPLGFIQQKSKPLVWTKLSDLKGKKLGVSEGYGNTVEFNRLVKEKVLTAIVVQSDATNVNKVAQGLLDGAVMDVNNARYLIQNLNPTFAGLVTVNSRIMENKDLFLAFNDHNKDKAEKLRRGLQLVNSQRIVDEYLLKYMQ